MGTEFGFISTVIVIDSRVNLLGRGMLEQSLGDLQESLQALSNDFELVLVNNGASLEVKSSLEELLATKLDNSVMLTLVDPVDPDLATWVGIEASIGDVTIAFDPTTESSNVLRQVLDACLDGADLVLARNQFKVRTSLPFKILNPVALTLYKAFTGIDPTKDSPRFRALTRNYVNFLLRHPQPALTYRSLPNSNGFQRKIIDYKMIPDLTVVQKRTFIQSARRGLRVTFSTSRMPLRIVAGASLVGAIGNLGYSVYVIVVALTQKHVAPGWTSSSLQQSGMFFLITSVLFVLSEYIVQVARLANSGPEYFIGHEFGSQSRTASDRLNLDEK